MRIFLTGAEGFVGRHFCAAVAARYPAAEVIAPKLDVTEAEAVRAAVAAAAPDFVVHLAAIAANAVARADPSRAWEVNLFGTINVAEAILAAGGAARLVFVSSSEVYGGSFAAGVALDETAALRPMTLYAATKAAAEMALGPLGFAGLRYVVLRPFNHIGPGQAESFVVSAFAGQIARIEAGLAPPVLAVGNLEPQRDFLDVRDVCDAYLAVLERFDTLPQGAVLNIASGQAWRIGDILNILLAGTERDIEVVVDPARLRGAEMARAVGDAGLARQVLGWMPKRELAASLREVLAAAR